MAGNYPDVPSWRMAYDRDGTQVFKISGGGVVTPVSADDVKEANSESWGWMSGITLPRMSGTNYACFIFPEHRDIDGYVTITAKDGNDGGGTRLDEAAVSVNTTNGVDGVWTAITAPVPVSTVPQLRNNIQAVTALGVKAIRFRCPGSYYGDFAVQIVHLFGEKAPNENLDRLEIWHPTLDQKAPPEYFDWGNSARASSATKTFRVKNISPTKTAQQVRVAMDLMTDSNPPILGQMSMSLDGAVWLAQVNVGDLGPGQISQVVSIRREMLSNAQMGLWWYRVFAESTASWV